MKAGIELAERGLAPDVLIRQGIRKLLRSRLQQEDRGNVEAQNRATRELIAQMEAGPVALHTQEANEQHYELPPDFFRYVMGRHMKYSSCYFENGTRSLDDAEAAMLALTCERAEIQDGMDVLELGCGWGSLTLWMGAQYPDCRITAVSNSRLQREFIEAQCRERGIGNVAVVTADMNDFQADQLYDRVVSVEMFEHLRNYREILKRISGWMKADAKLFIHIFTHRAFAYPFETEDETDWMGRYFFTGGLMPSDDLLLYFQQDVILEEHWQVDGLHYAKTARCWLENMDRNRKAILQVLMPHYGEVESRRWVQRWRMFFMACEELWGYAGGQEWGVSHYRFCRRNSG